MNVIASKIFGGLGNTMFQIATGYSKSLDENSDFIVDITELYNNHHPISKYVNNIFQRIKLSYNKIHYDVYNVPHFHYCELPNFDRNIKLS